MQQYQKMYYDQNVAPQIAAAQAQLSAGGQNGSYAGAYLAQSQAAGNQAAYQAGLSYGQQLYNNILQGRQSYYAGGPNVAQTQNRLDVDRGLGIASLQNNYATNNAQLQNQYNLSANQNYNNYNQNAGQNLNNFNLQNYNNKLNQYQINQQNKANMFGSLAGGAALLGSAFR